MKRLMMPVLLAALATGCSDDRLTGLAREAADRQARQNEEMARVTRESAEAAKRFVEAEEKSREDLNAMQQSVNDQRDQLETDRKDVASTRCQESILAPVLLTIGTLLICGLPLVICKQLLDGLREEASHPEVMEYLVQEVAAEQPRLLRSSAAAGAIAHDSQQPAEEPPNC